MRLYGMYYICKQYIDKISAMKVDTKTTNGNTIYSISSWQEKSHTLNELGQIPSLRANVKKLYQSIPTVYYDSDNFEISKAMYQNFMSARNDLMVAMKTVINLYEQLNPNSTDKADLGFDVKLPQFNSVGEFAKCLEDLDFIINQCPYLRQEDSEIKYGSVDVGSTWLTFLIVGGAAVTILTNFGKLVDTAIKVKSHFVTLKMQEEYLRSMELKSKSASDSYDTLQLISNKIKEEAVSELESELTHLSDGEERGKVSKSLEKLSYWMDKGMEIYSSIDAPKEIKDIFPEQAEMNFLSDNIMKLLERKKDTEDK